MKPNTPKLETLSDGSIKLTVILPADQPTVEEHAAQLEAGKPQVVRSAARGRLTGILKSRKVFTRQRTIAPGWILFTPCEPRNFKT